MGNVQTTLTVFALLSRHNSPQDAADDALWADLVDRVTGIVREDRYQQIVPEINANRDP